MIAERMQDIKDAVTRADDTVKTMILSVNTDRLDISTIGHNSNLVYGYSSTSNEHDRNMWSSFNNYGIIGKGKDYISDNTGGYGSLGADDILRNNGGNAGTYIDENGNEQVRKIIGYNKVNDEFYNKVGENVSHSTQISDVLSNFKYSDSLVGIVFPATAVGGRGYYYSEHAFNLDPKYDKVLHELCDKAGVDYKLMACIIAHETSGDFTMEHNAGFAGTNWDGIGYYTGTGKYGNASDVYVSEDGKFDAVEIAAYLGDKYGADTSNDYDPYMALAAGVGMFKGCLDQHNGDASEALKQYTGGSYGPSYQEIKEYYESEPVGGSMYNFK